jgi:transposase
MPRIAEQARPVTGGVDTHADVHVAAAVDQVGRVLGTQAFPADAAGYQAALAWMGAQGELAKVGVEGTGSYGAGLARYLAACGVEVAEVMRPNRQARRRRGKSDAADAVAAALAALSGEASGVPKSRDGAAEAGRALKVARAGAVKARTQAGNQLRDLILTAPEQVRQQLAGLPSGRQVDMAARFRPRDLAGPAEGAKAAMASVARRHHELAAEIARLDAALEELLTHVLVSYRDLVNAVGRPGTAMVFRSGSRCGLSPNGHGPSSAATEAAYPAAVPIAPAPSCQVGDPSPRRRF